MTGLLVMSALSNACGISYGFGPESSPLHETFHEVHPQQLFPLFEKIRRPFVT